jgi:hypothetical protein
MKKCKSTSQVMTVRVPTVQLSWESLYGGEFVVIGTMVKRVVVTCHSKSTVTVEDLTDFGWDVFPYDHFDTDGMWTVIG